MPYANVGPKKVPEGLTDEQVLFVTDVLPTSYWGTEIANVKAGDTVVVLGCGPIGLMTIKWCICLLYTSAISFRISSKNPR